VKKKSKSLHPIVEAVRVIIEPVRQLVEAAPSSKVILFSYFDYSENFIFSRKSFRSEAVDMNGRFQMQGGKNWILPK
jgi:hypothetical protein